MARKNRRAWAAARGGHVGRIPGHADLAAGQPAAADVDFLTVIQPDIFGASVKRIARYGHIAGDGEGAGSHESTANTYAAGNARGWEKAFNCTMIVGYLAAGHGETATITHEYAAADGKSTLDLHGVAGDGAAGHDKTAAVHKHAAARGIVSVFSNIKVIVGDGAAVHDEAGATVHLHSAAAVPGDGAAVHGEAAAVHNHARQIAAGDLTAARAIAEGEAAVFIYPEGIAAVQIQRITIEAEGDSAFDLNVAAAGARDDDIVGQNTVAGQGFQLLISTQFRPAAVVTGAVLPRRRRGGNAHGRQHGQHHAQCQ